MPPPVSVLATRLQRARAAMTAARLDVLLVTGSANIAYLTGLRMSAGAVLMSAAGAIVVADGRYAGAAGDVVGELPDVTLMTLGQGRSYEETFAELVRTHGWEAVGLEAAHLSLGRAAAVRRAAGDPAGVEWREIDGVVETLRLVKDNWEQATLREAGGRLSAVAACILPKVSAGQTERQVAWDIAVALHSAGFERPAFETIVASGPHAAHPHHRPTERRLEHGDLVIVDFGGVLDGYAVDLSRTMGLGVDETRQRWIDAVGEAQAAAIAAAGPGRLPSEVDGAARDVLAGHGLDRYFVHSTGHGLGLEVHERPTIGPRGDATGPLTAGVVFTVEPGVYVPDQGGVRIEDDVLVTATAAEPITF